LLRRRHGLGQHESVWDAVQAFSPAVKAADVGETQGALDSTLKMVPALT
jgi:hypothetical protein